MQTTYDSANNFEQCLKCTICTERCPVAAVTTDYPGPKQAGPDQERYRLKNPAFFDEALKMCLNCKRCEVACPSGVRIADIIQQARMNHAHRASLRDTMLSNTDFVGKMATMVAPVVNFTLGLKPTKAVMDSVMRIDKRCTFPAYAGTRFTTWFKRHAAAEQDGFAKHVSYFHGCYVNYNFPKLGRDLVKLLNAMGVGVHLLDKESCCGVALIANGLYKQARKQADANVLSMIKSVNIDRRPILTTSSSCTFNMRDEYEHLLGIDATPYRDSLMLATRWIYDMIDRGEARLAFRKDYTRRIAYHTACHQQRLGWAIYSIELLKMIPGVELTVLPQNCCGIAGTYGFKSENYERSQAIGATLFADIAAAAPDVVSTDCETCKWQIEMSTGLPVENPITTLADALDVEETRRLNLSS